jgi:starch-binding outer membrane protein, SusD/RagB family
MMTTMKAYLIYFLVFIIAGLTTGCSDFLEENLQGTYSNSTFYQTESHAELALTAVYSTSTFSSTANNIWVFADVASDDATKGGNPGDQSNIQFIEEFDYLPSNGYLQDLWTQYYEGITRTNYLLYHINDIDMDADRKLEIEGEALFMRSYFYFQLVNVFGEVPLKLNPPLSPSDVHVKLSTVAVIFDQLETDLTKAASGMKASVSMGRATKGSALGLLAKIRLFRKDYAGCLDAIADIDALGIYTLMPKYRDNFTLGNQNNVESLFEIQHLTGASPKLGSGLNQWFAPISEGGYFFNNPTQDFVDEFEVTVTDVVDPRLDYSVGREGQLWLNGEAFDPLWSPTGYINKKHLQPLAEVPKGTKGDGGLNYVYMRYADILLMKAEALNESGSTVLALAPLNAIRKRARESYLNDESLPSFGTVPADLLNDVVSTDQAQVRTAIRHERRVELGLEFHRFFDLIRYGSATAQAALSGTSFIYDQHKNFSIPQSEIDINKALK